MKADQHTLTFHQDHQNLLGPLHVPYHHPEGAHPYLELGAHLSSCHHDHPCEKENLKIKLQAQWQALIFCNKFQKCTKNTINTINSHVTLCFTLPSPFKLCVQTHMIPNIRIHIHTIYSNTTNSLQIVGWAQAILQSFQAILIEIKGDESLLPPNSL
jgi:hypothetical protein